MSDDFLAELDEDFKDDPDYQLLSREEKLRIVSVMEKMMQLGMAGVYGDESDNLPDGVIDCTQYIDQCKAKCCSYIFALTKDEVTTGLIQYNKDKPFFIAHDPADDMCVHLDRKTLRCTVWDNRPLRCRRYDCSRDEKILPEWL